MKTLENMTIVETLIEEGKTFLIAILYIIIWGAIIFFLNLELIHFMMCITAYIIAKQYRFQMKVENEYNTLK